MSLRVLLVGATGVFGGRLALMLAKKPDIQLILAARNRAPLVALQARIKALGGSAEIAVVDRGAPSILEHDPGLVIDAAGPFQGSAYTLALAAVTAGAHYLDLADARDFVAGFASAVASRATEAGVLAITGASSTPALSHAALAQLTQGWRRIDKVAVAISPGAKAPRGQSVVEAILSRVGQPLQVFVQGAWRIAPGWSHTTRLYMPGLGCRWVSLCDTPDLDLLARRFPIQEEALFLAGLEVAAMHLGLVALSVPVRLGLARTLRPLASPLRMFAGLLAPFGTDRGGMIVQACGQDADGESVRARWSLWADINAGPNTPAAPAAAVTARLAQETERRRGALTCIGVVTLDQILAELEGLPVWTRFDEGSPRSSLLFRRLLGRRFDRLPRAVRRIHGVSAPTNFVGRAVSRSGAHPLARLLSLAIHFPPQGRHEVNVSLVPDAGGETWIRRFGMTQFSSRLTDGAALGLFEEQFGMLRFVFDLRPTSSGVVWRLVGWNILGFALPSFLAPKIRARADERGARYHFQVVIAHAWIGLLVGYCGTLEETPFSADPPLAGRSGQDITIP